MGMFSAFAVLMALNRHPHQAKPKPYHLEPRFEIRAPLPTVPGVMIDTLSDGVGVAQQTAKSYNLQARIIWIDATANIDKYNTEEKIVDLVKQIKQAGFNTIVFDIKPISGQVVYKSAIAPKLTEWKGAQLPADFDPLEVMVHETRIEDLTLFVSLNAFSEGHQLMQVGPGYQKKDWQTVLYEPQPEIRIDYGANYPLSLPFDKFAFGKVCVFSSPESVPKTEIDGFAVVVGKDMRIQSSAEGTTLSSGMPPIPKGAVILFGSGQAGAFLKTNYKEGGTVEYDTTPDYVPISDRPTEQYPLMVNPNNPDVQRYEISIAQEVARNYPVDGMLYDDRFRYGGINADFSELTRDAFETYVGRKLSWPDDIFKFTLSHSLMRGIKPGPYYDAWMSWRAQVLHDYLEKLGHSVRLVRPGTKIGLYVGSWYGEYPALGDNYASEKTDAGFWFLTKDYKKAANAPLLDFLISGCYYPTATIYEAMSKGIGIGNSVESAGVLTNRMVRDECWTYAGIGLSDFKDNPEALLNALQAACASTQGVMVFDLSHDIEPMWPVFAKAFAQPRRAPHSSVLALQNVRTRRALMDKNGYKDPPVIIAAGSAGTGQ